MNHNQPDWMAILHQAIDDVPKEPAIPDDWTPGMSAEEKLAYIKEQLEEMVFADEETNEDQFWMDIESRCDNATDVIYENDAWSKKILRLLSE